MSTTAASLDSSRWQQWPERVIESFASKRRRGFPWDSALNDEQRRALDRVVAVRARELGTSDAVAALGYLLSTVGLVVVVSLILFSSVNTIDILIYAYPLIYFLAVAFFKLRATFAPSIEAIITDKLLCVLELLVADTGVGSPQKESDKRQLATNLEEAAQKVTSELPLEGKARDANTNYHLQLAASKIAWRLRHKKLWVILPQEETRQDLIASVVDDIEMAATSKWHAWVNAAERELKKEDPGYFDLLGTIEARDKASRKDKRNAVLGAFISILGMVCFIVGLVCLGLAIWGSMKLEIPLTLLSAGPAVTTLGVPIWR